MEIKEHCAWTVIDEDWNIYDTQCETAFQFNNDGPKENSFKFCPFCGRSIVEQELGGTNR